MHLIAGRRLGPFEIVSPLGAGGMGEVYRAHDTRLNRTVAIKVLPADLAADPGRRSRFRREARAISSLSHPHICALHDVGEADGVDFLVMEFLPGETLAHRLLRGPLPVDEAVRIGSQLADALEAAHGAGLIHRDLKPANVILTGSGAKVLDFGLAKWLDDEPDAATLTASGITHSAATRVGSVLGTLQYMAPEQIQGETVDTRADLFALGTVIYEMVAGRRAFEGTSASGVMAAILTVTPQPLMSVVSVAPPTLDRVVQKCLAKDRTRRWQTAADLTDALSWIAQDLRASADVVSASRRRQWLRAGAWVGSIGLAVAGVLLWRSSTSAPLQSVYATLDAPPGHVLGEDDRLAPLPTRTPMVFTPDGRALIVQAARNGKPQLFLRSLDHPDAQPIAGTADARVPFVSPDGKWVGFWAANELRKVPIDGGTPTTICRLDSLLGPNGASWSTRDTIVFGDDGPGRIMRVAAGGGTPVPATSAPTFEYQQVAPSFLPDGSRFLFSEVSALDATQARLLVQRIDGGEPRVIADSATDGRLLSSSRLAFMRLGTLMTASFDSAAAKIVGNPVAALGGVMQSGLRARAGANNTGAGMFAVSSLGTLAAIRGPLTGGEENRLVWVAPDGRMTSAEPSSGAPVGARLYVRVSPDGSRAAVTIITPSRFELWIADWTRDVWTRCTECRGDLSIPTVWSADGRYLLLGGWQTLVAHAVDASTADQVVLREKDRIVWPVSWLSDGRIVYMSSLLPSPDVEIKVVNPRQNVGQIIVPMGIGDEPDVSRDGRWLAYTLAPIGEGHIVVQSLAGASARTAISQPGGRNAIWSADGKTLYYLRTKNEEIVTFAADVRADAARVVAGTPRELFRNSNHQLCTPRCIDVGSGGRFVFKDPNIASRSPATRMDLVLNWTTLPQVR